MESHIKPVLNPHLPEATPAAGLQPELARLLGSVARHNFFADDTTDEFKVRREDDTEQGIFKVWAPHILPELDAASDQEQSSLDWADKLRNKPLSLYESIEQWRAFSEVSDRRLQTIFNRTPIPSEPVEAVAELLLRVNIGFAYAAPFYSIESLVVDPREVKDDNPIDFTEEHAAGGLLDLAAMLLPSVFGEQVVADAGDWNGLDWERIQHTVQVMREEFLANDEAENSSLYPLLIKVASLANVEPQDIIFASNALQFIPADVGGKREDLDPEEARALLEAAFDKSSVPTTSMVAKNANALIRFLNWCPALRSEQNFEGKQWSYGAVCDSVTQLSEIVATHSQGVFSAGFGEVFDEVLAAQLDDLDAASAKGRFLLQLFSEGLFDQRIVDIVEQRVQDYNLEIAHDIALLAEQEAILGIEERSPTYLTGGKAQGLRRAIDLFGAEHVAGGAVITSEAINAWLAAIPGLKQMIERLESLEDIAQKMELGTVIMEYIDASEAPGGLVTEVASIFQTDSRIVLRSSSYDEDVDIIGPAPGIYESVVNIDQSNPDEIVAGLKEVVKSFFSPKAIGHREFKQLRHKPLVAVLVQEHVDGHGGTVFIQNGNITLNLSETPSAINDMAAAGTEKYELVGLENVSNESRWLSKDQIARVLRFARKAEQVYGPSDLEFVVNGQGAVRLLQLRSLERPVSEEESVVPIEDMVTLPIDDLDHVPELNGNSYINLRLAETIDLDQFQGMFMRILVQNRGRVRALTLAHEIPRTCHFASIVQGLGIQLHVAGV